MGPESAVPAAAGPDPAVESYRLAGLIGRGAGVARRALRVRHVWRWLLAAAIAAYVVHFTGLSLDVHHELGTSSFDVGLYDQGLWLMSRFHAPFVTLMGRNLMGDHTSFILVPLVPLYWFAPGIGTLYFLQTAALAAGAVPVFLYGRRRLGSEWMALVGALAYLLHPAVGFTNLENFHPDAFSGVLVGFAIYAALERRWRTYAVFVALALLVKEDVALVIVPLGVWVAIRRDRRIGVMTILASLAFMAFALFVVMRSLVGTGLRNAWRIPFGGPFGFLRRAVSHPGDVVDHLRSDSRGFYLWQMTAPFAFVFARLPDVALISALVLFTNVLSTFGYQYSINYHYSLIAVPALAIGTVHALGAVAGRARVVLVALVGVTSLWASYLWGPLSWSRFELAYWAPDHPVAVALREIIDEIPGDAAVSAFHSATPHLAHRREIYQFPNPFRVVMYGPDISLEGTRLDDRAQRIEFVLLPTSLDQQGRDDWAVIAPAFDLVDANEGWELYRRDADVALAPLPPPDG